MAGVNASVAQVKNEAPPVPVQVQAAPPVQVQIQLQPIDVIQDVRVMPGGFGGPAMMQPARLTQADAIVVGRVVAIEPMDVQAAPAAGQAKVNYRVAVIQVSEPIHGVKKETQTIRVGFMAQANGPNVVPPGGGIQILPVNQPAIQPFPGGRRVFPGNVQMNLEVGQDGMFTLNKHHQENFFVVPGFNNFINRQNNPNFDNEVKTAKQLGKVMGDPVAALKAEDKQDRYLAAAILVSKYRTPFNPTGMPMKSEKITAEESKLILQAIAGGDWTAGRFNAAVPNPYELFNQLGITQNDGYNPVNVRTQQDIAAAMQKWLDENNGKYVVSKLVVDTNAKPGQPGVIQPGVDPVPLPNIRPGIRPLPAIKGKVQILPAPVPQQIPAPQVDPVQPQAVPVPPAVRREK
jgi:hypothetical protein